MYVAVVVVVVVCVVVVCDKFFCVVNVTCGIDVKNVG